jgi:C4-dicarboxylate-binding protein DctP
MPAFFSSPMPLGRLIVQLLTSLRARGNSFPECMDFAHSPCLWRRRIDILKDAPGIKWAALFGLFMSLTGSDVYASDAPVTIRISTQNPTQSNLTFIHFKERVEAESKGGIHVEIFDSAKLYGDSEIAEAVSSGAVEMGWVTLPRYAAIIPAADVFQLPFLFNTEAIAAAARAPQSEIRQLIDDAILVQGRSRVLWWVSQGPLVFLSNGVSIADPRNLAGKTARTFGPTMAAVVRGCGGEPKDIGGQAQERAYETHTVDIGMTGIAIVMERRLWRFMNVVTRTNHAILESLVVMNEAFWQRLSEDHKKKLPQLREPPTKRLPICS